jgi:DNA-binding response OmpR family regulator
MSGEVRNLIVEDDASVREMLAEYLCTLGYDVEQAADGFAMRAAIEQRLPDVVLLDLDLPGEARNEIFGLGSMR